MTRNTILLTTQTKGIPYLQHRQRVQYKSDKMEGESRIRAALQKSSSENRVYVFAFIQALLSCSSSHSRNLFRSLPSELRNECELSKNNRSPRTRDTWCAPEQICVRIGHWLLQNRKQEAKVRDSVASSCNGVCEKRCSSGFVDILSEHELIECKNANSWKQGLGQLMAYHVDFPNHKKVLCLFGGSTWDTDRRDSVRAVCLYYDVEVRFQTIEAC